MKRSDEPVYWLLFGAGGVVAAILLPIMILITGLLVPLGVLNAETLSYDKMHALATSWWGAAILLAVIALPIYHAMHRIYHGLHDLGIHPTKFLHYLLYGFAFLVSVAALTLLIQMH
jgi:fumarate reductase subunit D